MPFKYQPTNAPDPYDPILSRDIRIGINPAKATIDFGRVNEVGQQLQYDPSRDVNAQTGEPGVAGSPDLLSYGASLPIRGIGMLAEGVGGAMAGVSEMINNFGPARAYAEGPGKVVGGIGGTILDWIGGPGRFVQDIGATMRLMFTRKEDLPDDIQGMMNMGTDQQKIVEYMRETGRSFSDDKTMNLAASLLLDPLNLTPFVFGKVAALPAALKVVGVGGGAAAGSGLGIAGMAGGAALGYKSASTVISKLPRSLRGSVGLDLSRKIRLVQAMEASGRPLGGLSKYKYIADMHAGLFDKVRGVSDAVKGAFAWKITDSINKAMPGAYETVDSIAAGPFPQGTERIAARRLGLASQQTALSTVRDMEFAGISDEAAAATETLVSDVIKARQMYLAGEIDTGVTQYLIRQASAEGRSLQQKYMTDELALDYEVSQILDTAASQSDSVRLNPDAGDLQLWKSRRTNTLRSAAVTTKGLDKVDWQTATSETLAQHADEMTKRMTGLLVQGAVDESVAVSTLRANSIVTTDIVGLADELANASSTAISTYGKRTLATPEQLDYIARTWLGGARLENGRIVGGKYFSEVGELTENIKLRAELGRQIALARHLRYGFVINRAGNVRRVFSVAQGFDAMNDVQKAAAKKEVQRLTGRVITDDQMRLIGSNPRAARLTILRADSLLDTEVNRWLQAHAMLTKAETTIDDLAAIGLPDDMIAALRPILRKNTTFDPASALAVWARYAGNQFADVRNMEYGSRGGAATPGQVKALLDSALTNDAAFVAAKERDLEDLRMAWAAAGGDPADINGLDDSVRASGYRLGIAPENGVIVVPTTMSIPDPALGTVRKIVMKTTMPYVDITSDFVDGLTIFKNRPTEGFFGNSLRRMFGATYQTEITGRARQKLVSVLAPYMTPDEIALFDSKINELAAQKRIGTRGLVSAFGGKSDIENAADAAIRELNPGDSWAKRLSDAVASGNPRLDIDIAILRAYAGDITTSGVTQWITGQIKANGIPGIGMAKAIALITENFYPTLKYAYNPLFWVQEVLESPFFGEARGIRRADMEESLIKAGFSKRVPDGEGGFKIVADGQAVRNMLGERGSTIARNMHEAAFGTMVATRSGIPSTLVESISDDSVISMIKRLRKSGSGSVLDNIAEFKEAHRDMMAIKTAAEDWSAHVAKTQPQVFVELVAKYGNDELDIFLGYLGEHRRAVDLAFGGEALNHLPPPGYGWAVRPSTLGLARARASAEVFTPFSESQEAMELLLNGRPRDFVRLARINVVDEARAAGYEVTQLESKLREVEEAARLVKRDLPSYGVENIKGAESYKALNQAVTKFKDEVINGLGRQASKSQLDELIVRELYRVWAPQLFKAERFEDIMQALANGRRYGMKFRSIGTVIQEIFDRAGGNGLFNMSTADATAQISSVVNNLLRMRGVGIQSQTRRIARTLHDSAIRLIEDHGAEEAFFRATKFRYQEAARQMDRVNYFNPDRGLVERTMNHQFLALYPLSYMFGKVLPEVTRFLFWRPFGAIAPGAGYQAYSKITEYLSREGFAPDFEEKGMQRPDYLFLLSQLIPGHPDDIGVGVPGWLRRSISTVSRQGYDQLTAAGMFGEVPKAFSDTGLFGAGKTAISGLQEILSGYQTQDTGDAITTLR